MKRREFLTLAGGAAASAPFAARAQQPAKLPTIGFMSVSTPAAWSHFVQAFEQRLGELGWVNGRNVAIEYRWAEGRTERFVEISAEFVRLKVDVILTGGSAVLAAKQATSTIPIVFALANDPLGAGLVASLSRPGGNVTGLSLQGPDIGSKRLGLMREALPGLNRLAIIANPASPQAATELDQVKQEARAIGFEPDGLEIRRAEDFAPAIEALKGRADALYAVPTRSSVPMRRASTRWRRRRGCRRCFMRGNISRAEASCPMDRTCRICSGAPPILSTRFCVAQSRATFQSSSRPRLNWSSISRPPKPSVSRCRRHCSPAPTR
jgi:ABC-type uncharacterized transport system substrate-binding protein